MIQETCEVLYLEGYYRTEKGAQKKTNEEIMHKIPHRMYVWLSL